MNAVIKPGQQTVTISAPKIRTAMFEIVGTAPLMINKYSHKAQEAMRAQQEAGSQAKSKKKRDPKDFNKLFEAAQYRADDGWCGLAAASVRNALIGACRLVDYKMTLAKLSIFVVADGLDAEDGTPLVRIYGDKPQMDVRPARNANGSFDLRARPMWKKWSCKLKIQWDDEQFSLQDVTNLLTRVGIQCGLGEGRPSSKMSYGIGFGTFTVKS